MAASKYDSELRTAIIAEMKRKFAEDEARWPAPADRVWLLKTWGYCTWWFKFVIQKETRFIRRELEIMERDGLVTADRSRSNNTLWRLVEAGHDSK